MSEPRLKQINDHLFEVCTPPIGSPSMEVVFFHGLQAGDYREGYWRTWMSRDMSEMWLGWLQEVFPEARVLTISYGSLSWRTSEMYYPLAMKSSDMYPLAEGLMRSIVNAGIGQQPGCPVLLVGHSFGGLVMKALCVVADMMLWKDGSQRCANGCYKFLQNVKGHFFFSTPHGGSGVPEAVMDRGPFAPGLAVPGWNILKLANNFRERRGRYKWRTSGVGETRATILEDFVSLFVPEASSKIDMVEYQLLDGDDHFDVCRPHHRTSDSFLALTAFIGTLLEDIKEEEESKAGKRDFTKAEANVDMNAFRWYEDPLTWEKMCDPVKCSDGRTYDRWTILDKKMCRSPYDRNLTTFRILCDDIDAKLRLLRVFPEQELELRDRRERYREEALQHARADPIQFEGALEKLSNVVKWMPLDHECQTELTGIQSLVTQLRRKTVVSKSPPPSEESRVSRSPITIREIRAAGIPVLMHEDVIRARQCDVDGSRSIVFFVFIYMLFWFLIPRASAARECK